MADADRHMLSYWIKEKGIEEAFKTYYPELARTDPIINQALAAKALAEKALMARVEELEEEAEPCAKCEQWACDCRAEEV